MRILDADNFLDWLDVGHLINPDEIHYSENDINRMICMQPTVSDYVSLCVYKQVAWERDIAIEQLNELGYQFGEKIDDDQPPRGAITGFVNWLENELVLADKEKERAARENQSQFDKAYGYAMGVNNILAELKARLRKVDSYE